MKKVRNGLINNLRYLCLLSAIAIGLMTIIATGGGGGGAGDPCAGPVPCLTQDWGGTFYEFHEPNGSPIIISSYGNVYAVAGLSDDGDTIVLGGDVIDCYNGDISEGAIDYSPIDGNCMSSKGFGQIRHKNKREFQVSNTFFRSFKQPLKSSCTSYVEALYFS